MKKSGSRRVEMSGCWAAMPQPDVSRNADDEPHGVRAAGGDPAGEVVENRRLGAAMKWVEERQEARDKERLHSRGVSLREKKWIRKKSPAQDRVRPHSPG